VRTYEISIFVIDSIEIGFFSATYTNSCALFDEIAEI